jgi:alanyl-tRNA synthetase
MLSDKEVEQLKHTRTDKDLKKIFKQIASKNPNTYFPTKELKQLGYIRKQCKNCGVYFWTTLKNRNFCGDPTCAGGFKVTSDNPVKVKLSYVGVWKKIVEILEPRGYKPIKRYPCVARWNPTSEFTIASISAFQPYVITGEVDPPAKKLIIPQFCLRFNDIENVGLTGSHASGFVMIGQHFFGTPEEWNQGELFMDIHDFIHIGVGLPKEEITIHEDSWAGGGSFGCSLEFFSRGVELFNQVYTMFEQTSQGPRELSLKVLDMGLGQERVAWFSQGTPNIYEATFPKVLSKLRALTRIKLDFNLYIEFSKYSAYLNIDEVEDLDEAWQKVGKELNIEVDKLKNIILPMTALYSIAEHARTLLFGINDGKLPSNTGGGYNLRVIFRRAIGFIDEFNWDIDLADVCEWHAEELFELFPEVSEHLKEIREILEVEKVKYYRTKEEALKTLKNVLKKGDITKEMLIELYDSKGINPEMVKKVAFNFGKIVKIPDNFYSLIVESHEKVEQIHATEKKVDLNLKNVPNTKSLYYFDYTKTSNEAKVLKIINKMVIVDQSVAYPTSGGQLHDIGTINGQKFNDVFRQGNHVIHVLEENPIFYEGAQVIISVDKRWRKQLSQHHTATHIVNAAAREVLGSHINQAGAKKTLRSSHLDITHYEQISHATLKIIEEKANDMVNQEINLNLSFMPRSDAEQKYGMGIYQGGAVPGKYIRIVEIPGYDVEACGGTHLNNTGETGKIRILNSQKIQDGVVRLTFTAGEATDEIEKRNQKILNKIQDLLNVKTEQIIPRIEELLKKWKEVNKALKSGKFDKRDLILNSKGIFKGEIIPELAKILNTKEKGVYQKIKKLYEEWNLSKAKLEEISDLLDDSSIKEVIDSAIKLNDYEIVIETVEGVSQKDLKNYSSKVVNQSAEIITIFIDKAKKGIILMGMIGEKGVDEKIFNMGNLLKEISENFDGKGGGGLDFGQGFIRDLSISLNELKTLIIDKIRNLIS